MSEEPQEQYPKTHSTLQKLMNERALNSRAFVPNGDSLEVDFTNLLLTIRDLERKPVMEPFEAISALNKLEDGKFSKVYDTTIKRIRDETNFLHDYAEMNLIADILNGSMNQKLKSRVNWRAHEDMRRANYVPETGEINIPGNPPNKIEFMYYLLTEARFPISFEFFVHENLHAMQYERTFLDLIKGVLDMFRYGFPSEGIELSEFQAYRMSSGTTSDSHTKRQLLEHVIQNEINLANKSGETLRIKWEPMLYSAVAIDQMEALGFTVPEIAEAVRRSAPFFDKKKGIYPYMQQLIDEKSKQLELTENDLETLTHVHRLERKIDRLRAQQIVFDELKKASEMK